MDRRQGRRGEFELIAELFAPLARGAPGALDLKDDAATITIPQGHELVVTADTLVEGVHFLKSDPPGSIARKSLRVNLSDLAAKGASAQSYMLALSLAPWIDDDWLKRFAEGLAADQAQFGVTLIGGDTTSTPAVLTITIAAFGTVPLGKMLKRGGARPGDRIFVSGTIGDAGGFLSVLDGEGARIDAELRDTLAARYRTPTPRTSLGPKLIGLASAAVDVSDGLLADVGHIADVSRARILIEAAKIPLSGALRVLWGTDLEAIIRAASAGDDYEIAFAAPESSRNAIANVSRECDILVHEIGRVEEGEGVSLLDLGGCPVALGRLGFTHF
jgi:thiamine-monophosphate kinase